MNRQGFALQCRFTPRGRWRDLNVPTPDAFDPALLLIACLNDGKPYGFRIVRRVA